MQPAPLRPHLYWHIYTTEMLHFKQRFCDVSNTQWGAELSCHFSARTLSSAVLCLRVVLQKVFQSDEDIY